MTIIFLCGSSESGRDGVGDYTRRLAEELIKRGHIACVIAFHDCYLQGDMQRTEVDKRFSLPTLRLSIKMNTKERVRKLSNWIEQIDPDWISLQFVGFGFNKYGLPIELLTLRSFIGTIKIHIMFHELWCGMSLSSGIRERMLGAVQKQFLKLLYHRLNPQKAFTSIRPYHIHLKNIGIETEIVSVFSNIPLHGYVESDHWNQILQRTSLAELDSHRSEWLVAGFFGTIYPCIGLPEMLKELNSVALQLARKFAILAIGSNRGLDIREVVNNDEIAIIYTGALEANEIDGVIKFADMGITTSPVDGICKSGSAMAWLERNIPVFVSAYDKTYSESEMAPFGVHQINDSKNVIDALKTKGKFKRNSHIHQAIEAYERLNDESS